MGRRTTQPDNLGPDRITDTVLSQIRAEDPRTGTLAASLITHVHDFIRENNVTWDEWMTGLDFLARVGQWTTESRNEAILMSDTSGSSTLVDALNNVGPPNMTPTTVEGPFHSVAPPRDMGDVIATPEQWARGDWTFMHGRVLDTDGAPLPGATIDIWQADQSGLYDVQDEHMQPGDLRALLTTDEDGRYWFRTVKPCSYPVPTDGPGGEWLRATGRQPMRPAHIHVRVEAPGHRSLVTHLFVAEDPYLDIDAAFGVRKGLVLDFPLVEDGGSIATQDMPGPYFDVEFDLVLVADDRARRS
ncbi:dioxygenase [Rhodococcus sp. NPDC076796]|uniref:dioxygenase family protein n=1 Tax=Rhodococcus sp. NPDC076796 TaxID=3154859 RepID=UPI00344F422A